MHRQISHVDAAFRQESNAGLCFFTSLLASLIGLDVLWPSLASWLNSQFGLALPVLADGITVSGSSYRFALIAAVLGGARVLYGSLASLLA